LLWLAGIYDGIKIIEIKVTHPKTVIIIEPRPSFFMDKINQQEMTATIIPADIKIN